MKTLAKFAACGMFMGLLGFADTVMAFQDEYIPAEALAFEAESAPVEADAAESVPPEADAVAVSSEPEAFRTTANLRLRSGPSLDAHVIRTVSNGHRVYVHDRGCGEWFRVSQDGTYGYMNAEFLWPAGNEPSGQAGAQAQPAQPAQPAQAQSVNGVELVDWSYVRNVIPRNTDLQITDVRTGQTFRVRSFSHGNHADVETVTQADTDTMRNVFGGWTWTPRPVWVTVNGRTFAASINGMPHAGSTINGNGMNGHVCLHFPGSRTHNGNRSHERDHQNAIQEAFRAA